MKTVKVKMFIHNEAPGVEGNVICTNDMQKYGYILLGTQEVEVTIPELTEEELIEAEINSIYEKAGEIESEALTQVLELRLKAKQLKESKSVG